jgi:hypothetical protein
MKATLVHFGTGEVSLHWESPGLVIFGFLRVPLALSKLPKRKFNSQTLGTKGGYLLLSS